MKCALILLLFAGVVQPSTEPAEPPPFSPMTVSLVELLANPAEFEGKQVQLIGFARTHKAAVAVYMTEESGRIGVPRTCVALEAVDAKTADSHDKSWVAAGGTFRTIRPEDGSDCAGELIGEVHVSRYPPKVRKQN